MILDVIVHLNANTSNAIRLSVSRRVVMTRCFILSFMTAYMFLIFVFVVVVVVVFNVRIVYVRVYTMPALSSST